MSYDMFPDSAIEYLIKHEGCPVENHDPACPGACLKCGKPEGSFACKIRHLQMNTGAAKAAND